MARYDKQQYETIVERKNILEDTRKQLKKEFVGIDNVIDTVIEMIGTWYMFPEAHTKPVVVNLWGMTGVGKTSLISRLSECIGFKNRYYHFDLHENSWSMRSDVSDIYKNTNGKPFIMMLDEFQHARTISAHGEEGKNKNQGIIWKLLDSGIFQSDEYNFRDINKVYDIILRTKRMLREGVEVKNGKVVKGKQVFNRYIEIHSERSWVDFEEKDKKYDFLKPEDINDLYKALSEDYEDEFAFYKTIYSLDGRGIMDVLWNAYNKLKEPKIIDCSHALIFVAGNLDEAYTMSNNFSPDISADQFHQQSLQITVSDIKNVLKNRFRNEQIARLGNNHVIYPAFNKKTYQTIIDKQLDKTRQMVYHHTGAEIQFHTSLKNILYKEGVYPTQGTRPVYSTIHYFVESRIGAILYQFIINTLSPDTIHLSFKGKHLKIAYYRNNECIHTHREKVELTLEKLRKNKKNDAQAISAVHEAGHAIISALLLRVIPESVHSITTGPESSGFTSVNFEWDYIAKNEITNRIATWLGGLAAERVIYGDDHITAGAETDIAGATHFAGRMIKMHGLGQKVGAFTPKDIAAPFNVYDRNNEVNDEIEAELAKGMKKAEETLRKEEALLLKIADHLSDHRYIKKNKLEQFILQYAKSPIDNNYFLHSRDDIYYRRRLKDKVKAIDRQTHTTHAENTMCENYIMNRRNVE